MQQHTQTKKDVLFLSSACNNVKSFKEKKSELWMQRFNNFISLSNAPVSGSAVSVGSQNYKDQHAQSSTWKNVVYNILVLRFLRGGPARGRKKILLVLICSHELRKLNTETTKSVLTHLYQRRYLPVRCESCLKTRSSVFAALHTNRQEAFCHLIFHSKARFSKEKVWICTMLMYLCPGAV